MQGGKERFWVFTADADMSCNPMSRHEFATSCSSRAQGVKAEQNFDAFERLEQVSAQR